MQSDTPHIIEPSTFSKTITTQTLLSGSFGWMVAGLLVSAAIALIVQSTPAFANLILGNKFGFWILIIIELGVVWYLSSRIMNMSGAQAQAVFVGYSALSGATLSGILMAFAPTSIISIFIGTAVLFALLALFGATTKTDLSSWGRIVFFGLIALIVTSIINMFIGSSGLDYIISWVGVIIFCVLTARDTQKIIAYKELITSEEDVSRFQTLGALTLYLDFINLFIFLLRLFGRRS